MANIKDEGLADRIAEHPSATMQALRQRIRFLEDGIDNIASKCILAHNIIEKDDRGQCIAKGFAVIAEYARGLLPK